jgi:hypothetical protein
MKQTDTLWKRPTLAIVLALLVSACIPALFARPCAAQALLQTDNASAPGGSPKPEATDQTVGIGISDRNYVYGPMDFSLGNISGLKVDGPYQAYYYSSNTKPIDVKMSPLAGSICFLTHTYNNTQDHSFWNCQIAANTDGSWHLYAQVFSKSLSELTCEARCLVGLPLDPSQLQPATSSIIPFKPREKP